MPIAQIDPTLVTRIDFYIAENNSSHDRLRLCCKIVEKASRQGKRTIIAVDDRQQAMALDELMWRFQDDSFLPHTVAPDSLHDCQFATNARINTVIDSNRHKYPNADLIINLCTVRPEHFSQYERLVECITQEGSTLQIGRDNHQYYKERGYPIHIHKLGTI